MSTQLWKNAGGAEPGGWSPGESQGPEAPIHDRRRTARVGLGVFLGVVSSQLIILYLYRFFSYSRAVFVIYAILVAASVILSRTSLRLLDEFLNRQRETGSRVVIYGAGDGGAIAVRELLKRPKAVRIVGFIDFRDDAARIVQVALAGLRHAHMARGAVEQLHAQPLLQRSHGARDGRRRHAEPARAGREALLLGHGHVDGHQVKAVHLRFTMKSIKCRTRNGMRLRCG